MGRYRAAARLVALAGAVGVGLFLFRAAPREVRLVYGLGGAPPAERLEVEVRRGGETLRRAEFRLAPRGPGQVSHVLRLPDGEYVLRATFVGGGGPPRAVERTFTVSESGSVVVPLGG